VGLPEGLEIPKVNKKTSEDVIVALLDVINKSSLAHPFSRRSAAEPARRCSYTLPFVPLPPRDKSGQTQECALFLLWFCFVPQVHSPSREITLEQTTSLRDMDM
jgi:hypothetical protein